MDLELETCKDMSQEGYDKIKTATANMLRDYGLSWETLSYSKVGPHHQGLTRLLNWKEKGSKHFYIAMIAKINRETLTTESEGSINQMLGQRQSIDFLNGMYRNSSKIYATQDKNSKK